jgi:transcriptional regulator with XRE-family HTH domain
MAKMRPGRPTREVLALNIQVARTVTGWSQEKLGLQCGLKRTYIGALERREINLGIDNLDKIATGLGIASHVLIQDSDEAYPLIHQSLKRRNHLRRAR